MYMVVCRYGISLWLFNFLLHLFAALIRGILSWTLEEIFHIYMYVCPRIILYLLLYRIITNIEYMLAKTMKFTPGFPWNQAFWNHNLTEHCSYFQNWSSLHLVSTQSCVLFHRWFLLVWYLMTHRCAVGGDEGWSLWYPHLTGHCYCFPSCTPYYHLNREMAIELSCVIVFSFNWFSVQKLTGLMTCNKGNTMR